MCYYDNSSKELRSADVAWCKWMWLLSCFMQILGITGIWKGGMSYGERADSDLCSGAGKRRYGS